MPSRILARIGAGLALALLSCSTLGAQQALYAPGVDGPALGVYGGVLRGGVSASFAVDGRGLTQDGECGRYESGEARGVVVGLFCELPVTPLVALYGGVDLSMRTADLAYRCVDPANTRMPDGSTARAETEFRASSAYDVASLELGATLRPLRLPLVIAVTPALSLCTGSSYSAREVIVEPREASFVSGGQERAVGAGEMGSGDLSVSLGASLWYEAQISRSFSLVPRVGGRLALVDEISESAMRMSGFEVTLGLLYRFPPPNDSPSPIEAGGAPAR